MPLLWSERNKRSGDFRSLPVAVLSYLGREFRREQRSLFPTSIGNNQNGGTRVAPLGLRVMENGHFYKPVAPLGLKAVMRNVRKETERRSVFPTNDLSKGSERAGRPRPYGETELWEVDISINLSLRWG